MQRVFTSAEERRTRMLLQGYHAEAHVPEASNSGWIYHWPVLVELAHPGLFALCSAGATLLALFLSQQALCVVIFPGLLGLRSAVLHSRKFRKVEAFERDYPALLVALAAGVRTGLDPFVALCNSVDLFSTASELRSQLAKLRMEIDRGASEEEAVRSFAADIEHPDLPLFRSAFILSRKEGSSLAESLQRLARVTRQRQSFRRKIRAAVSMQRLSAFGIALCTVVVAVIQVATNPAALEVAFANPVGKRAICGGLGLVLFGLGWMLSLSKSRI